jgi:uncharacterized protein (DUF433 family)
MKRTRDIYGGKPPADVPAYTAGMVAAYLHVANATVRYWAFGDVGHPPILHVADTDARMLSFNDLTEVHVLKAVTKTHQVPLQEVRQFVEYLRHHFDSPRPLLDERMLTDGKRLYVEKFGTVIQTSKSAAGQMAITVVWESYLKRIRRDDHGVPLRLHPFTRTRLEDPQLVMIDPRTQFGRPCITDTGVPTAVVAERFKAGESTESIAEDYGRSRIEIEEALRYETELRAA